MNVRTHMFSKIDRLDGLGLLQLPPRRARLRLGLQIALILTDSAMLLFALTIANLIWFGNFASPYDRGVAVALIPLYVAIGVNTGAFSAGTLTSSRRGLVRSLRALMFGASGVILAAFFVKAGEHVSRLTLCAGSLLGAMMLIMVRTVFPFYIRRRFGAYLHTDVIIVDGCDVTPTAGAFILDAKQAGLRCDMRDPMMLDRIGRLLAPADRVVIACEAQRRRDWAMVLKGANVRGEVICPELNSIGPLGTSWFEDDATVVISSGSLDFRQRIAKRLFDLTLASIALLVLAPFLVLTAIAVRLDSPGPIFFVQDRVGRGNRLFGIFKFRSMHTDSCDQAGNRSTARHDKRITRVGRIIRTTSIDELPQLINILKGDMSFVGPRPHALGSLAGDQLFWEVDERYWHRHACKPGLTGLAQIRGFRGATHHSTDLTNRLQADLEYLSGWTILRDISILLATLRVVMHRNAY